MNRHGIPVLTYHSQNISGNDYGINDHVCLERDLAIIAELGMQVRPLADVVRALFHDGTTRSLDRIVCLSFDDGTLFDVADLEHPEHGPQKAMRSILADFARDHPGLDWTPHATAFVIASPQVRAALEQSELGGLPWLGEEWWAEADASDFLTIGNHSWDHRHPAVVPPEDGGGNFATVNDEPACREQIVDAGRYIAERTGRWPELFAYPFGHASEYLREEYFPRHFAEHRTIAAFSTEPGYLASNLNPWLLPRFICGHHWRTEQALIDILQAR